MSSPNIQKSSISKCPNFSNIQVPKSHKMLSNSSFMNCKCCEINVHKLDRSIQKKVPKIPRIWSQKVLDFGTKMVPEISKIFRGRMFRLNKNFKRYFGFLRNRFGFFSISKILRSPKMPKFSRNVRSREISKNLRSRPKMSVNSQNLEISQNLKNAQISRNSRKISKF